MKTRSVLAMALMIGSLVLLLLSVVMLMAWGIAHLGEWLFYSFLASCGLSFLLGHLAVRLQPSLARRRPPQAGESLHGWPNVPLWIVIPVLLALVMAIVWAATSMVSEP